MFNFLRKYNKIILAVFGSLLMVAFLIEGTVSMWQQQQRAQPIGAIGDRALTLEDRRQASMEIRLLQAARPPGDPFNLVTGNDPLRWLLMQEEARALGLYASPAEVQVLYESTRLSDAGFRANLLDEFRVSEAMVRQALKRWLIAQRYVALIKGLSPLSPDELGQRTQMAFMSMLRSGNQVNPDELAEMVHGKPRVSRRLTEHLIADHLASARITMAAVPADRLLEEVPEPDDETVRRLFERYRDELPGEGAPWGLGYRYPDRLKLSVLTLPFQQLFGAVSVDYADIVAYYDENPGEFLPEEAEEAGEEEDGDEEDGGEDQTPEPRPLAEVQQRIERKLRREAARKLGERIARFARAELLEQARTFPREQGYRQLPPDWEPAALEAIADTIRERFGIEPDVRHPHETWLTPEALAELPSLGNATLTGETRTAFADYALTCRELEPDPDNPLVTRRLQAHLPSEPLVGPSGNWSIFRVEEAIPEHSPESLEEVGERVRRDARRIAAYELLTSEARRTHWLEQARAMRLETLAESHGLQRRSPPPFPRRVAAGSGAVDIPDVPGVGRSRAFVDAVFQLALDVHQAGGGEAPARERIAAIGVKQAQALMLVRLEAYEPVDRETFEQVLTSPIAQTWIQDMLSFPDDADPLTVEAISQRIGFVPREDS